MSALLLTPAILSATAAAAQDGPDPLALEPDQITATAENVAEKELPKPWNADTRAPRQEDVFEGDYAIVGVGVASLPTYDGSNSSRIIPAAGMIGRVGGIGFRLRGPNLTTDLIDDKKGAKIGVRFGPNIRWRAARKPGDVKDPVVALLPEVKSVVDVGVGAGLNFRKVLTKQDSLSVGLSARWAVSGGDGGRLVTASTSYLLPVSKAQVIGLQATADFMDGKYARYNYSISPAASAASGLPAFRARGGFQEASVGAFTARDLSGNFLDGGFAVGVGAMYSRLYGSAARTPTTSLRGSRNQWLFGGGLAYSF